MTSSLSLTARSSNSILRWSALNQSSSATAPSKRPCTGNPATFPLISSLVDEWDFFAILGLLNLGLPEPCLRVGEADGDHDAGGRIGDVIGEAGDPKVGRWMMWSEGEEGEPLAMFGDEGVDRDARRISLRVGSWPLIRDGRGESARVFDVLVLGNASVCVRRSV